MVQNDTKWVKNGGHLENDLKMHIINLVAACPSIIWDWPVSGYCKMPCWKIWKNAVFQLEKSLLLEKLENTVCHPLDH